MNIKIYGFLLKNGMESQLRRLRACFAVLYSLALLFSGAGFVFSQESADSSIPEELLRPRRGESPRYPVDMVIGELGRGRASEEAYTFAVKVADALLAGTKESPALASANKVFIEGCMSALNEVSPRLFRLGSGREEPDGSVSYLVRFIGREQGITGELFIRYEEQRTAPIPANDNIPPETEDQDGKTPPVLQVNSPPPEKIWKFEDLVLEQARSREEENKESSQRFDFPPYERFF